MSSVTLSEGLQYIGEYAFYKCIGLESLTIPSTVNRIDNHAFCSCENITSLTILDGVDEIGFSAFLDLKKLPSVKIPKSVMVLDEWAFSGCDNLDAIDVDDDNQNYSDIDGVLFNKDHTILMQYLDKCGDSYTVPEGVTKLAKGAFCDTKIKSIKLADSLEVIGFSAFEKCHELESIEITSNVKMIDDFAFKSCTRLKSLIIPQGVESIGSLTFDDCTSLESVTISQSVKRIGNRAFGGCTSLKSVTIDNYKSGINIDKKAFLDTVNITYLQNELEGKPTDTVTDPTTEEGKVVEEDCG